jgi:hypothetical protein
VALADYYRREAVAIAQVLAGYDELAIAERLDATTLAVAYSREAAASLEGQSLVELTIRLTARLFPSISVVPPDDGDTLAVRLRSIAQTINPRLDLEPRSEPTVGISVGKGASQIAPATIYAGSNGWDALISTKRSVSVGDSSNPFGAGASAALAVANAFRCVFRRESPPQLDENLRLPTLGRSSRTQLPRDLDVGDVVLVGVGAVGNAAAWSLARAGLSGRLHLIDAETLDLGNLQRYVLADRSDEGRPKVDIAARQMRGTLRAVRHPETWQEFAAHRGTHWPTVLVALDSAADRRAVQASLPRWIANAWTQPGDLGVSSHRFTGEGPCLSCLYLPAAVQVSEDQIYAQALGIPDQFMQIRELMYHDQGAPAELLELVAGRLGVDRERVLEFTGRPIRTIYREGICGGAILPVGATGSPRVDVHVPLAHQSALAGILLGARCVAHAMDGSSRRDRLITRVNVMRPVNSRFMTQSAAKDPRGICICQDADWVRSFRRKYSP